MNCSLIMAGGKGTRFWPASTEEKPKQFLTLFGEKTMLQICVERLQKNINIEQIFIVTGEQYVNIVREQIPVLPIRNIIIEPIGRNTAPCVLLSCIYIQQIYADAIINVVASDAVIVDEVRYSKMVREAYDFIENNKNGIVTLGILPDRPETGYGYIQYQQKYSEANGIHKVKSFKEKPDLETANNYLRQGNYLWNAGMFIFSINYFLSLAKEYMTESFELLINLPSIFDANYQIQLNNKYKKCQSISFDYAIAEKCKEMYVIPCSMGWDDIGSWQALQRYQKKDNNQNVVQGNFILDHASNNVLYSQCDNNKKVVIVGLDDIFYIESDGIVIIGSKANIDEVIDIRDKI